MPAISIWSRLPSLASCFRATPVVALLGVALLASCNQGDVGAPCNHGILTSRLTTKAVTFPALSCDELLCVYADEAEPPSAACDNDAQCNEADTSKRRFYCDKEDGNETGSCKLNIDYILERSMCSKRCESDADCRDGGVGNQVTVDETSCSTNFQCVRIQSLGEFCCEKICVCGDDISESSLAELDRDCSMGDVPGCCDQDNPPSGCGQP